MSLSASGLVYEARDKDARQRQADAWMLTRSVLGSHRMRATSQRSSFRATLVIHHVHQTLLNGANFRDLADVSKPARPVRLAADKTAMGAEDLWV
jgi:hypothetical protein